MKIADSAWKDKVSGECLVLLRKLGGCLITQGDSLSIEAYVLPYSLKEGVLSTENPVIYERQLAYKFLIAL